MRYDDFTSLENLERLDLSFNLFHDWKDIIAEGLNSLHKLVFLDFSSNPLRTVPQYSRHFQMQSLEVLKLNNCSLFSIHPEVFSSATSLKELYLTQNPVRNLSGSFTLKNAKLLDLSHCSLEVISRNIIQEMDALELLILQNNTYLRSLTLNSKNLQLLDLSECNLERIPLGSLNTVTELRMDKNFLKQLSENSFLNYPNLISLNLSINALSDIHQNAFRGLDNIKRIDLSQNKIGVIDEKLFLPTIMLEELILSHNYVRSLDEITSSSIKILDVSYCEIYTISSHSLANMPKLKTLSLRRNFISSIPDGWIADRLRYLDLSGCRIRSITNKTFEKMSNLERIDLSGNQLTLVEAGNFDPYIEVILKNNPFNCECPKLEELYFRLAISGLHQNLICDSPAKLQGLTWEEACGKQWDLSNTKSKQIWWYTFIVILSLAILLITILALKKINDVKENNLREAEERRETQEREAREALERMHALQREYLEDLNRNAPDPRENHSPPPSYPDALLLPKLDTSQPNLAGSYHSLAGSNSSLNKKGKTRRKRRRRRSQGSESKRQSRASLDDTGTSEEGPSNNRPHLESDF